MKTWVKQRCADVIGSATVSDRPRVVVLAYHTIGPQRSVTPELFRSHLEWLKQNCVVIRFAEAIDALRRPRSARPAVAITFDDGYRDAYDYAFSILDEYSLPATLFLTIGLIDDDPRVVDRLRLLRNCSHDEIHSLDWSQISEMRTAGFEFGAHTYSHPNLMRLDPAELDAELRRPKEVIEEHLREPITMLAYPFGKPRRHFSGDTVGAAGEAGYELAGTTVLRGLRASDAPLALPRILVGDDDLATLRQKTNGAWDFMGIWQERSPRWVGRLLSPGDFKV